MLFFSCARLPHKSSPQTYNLKAALRPVCLDSSGRGRLEMEGRRYLFNYDSLHDHGKKIWSFEINAPLGRGGVFHLNYSKASRGKIKTSGDFPAKLKNNELLLSWAQILQLKSDGPSASPPSDFKWQQKNGVLIMERSGVLFEAFQYKKEEGYYQRLRLTMKKETKLNLFLSSCSSLAQNNL